MGMSELVSSLIDAGSKLIKALDQQGTKVGTAFWNYDEETDEWRLVLSMPIVDEKGEVAAQDSIARALKAARVKDLYLRHITVTSPKNKLVLSVNLLVRTPADAIGGFRIGRSAVSGEWIESAHIYRSSTGATPGIKN